MLFKIQDVIQEIKKQIEEKTNEKFQIIINKDYNTKRKNDFFFICSDSLNIEIVLSNATINGICNKDFVDCRIQKPYYKNTQFDFRNIHAKEKCTKYIVQIICEILKK